MKELEQTSLSEAEEGLRRALRPRSGQVETLVRQALAEAERGPRRLGLSLPGRLALAALSLAGIVGLALLLGRGAARTDLASPQPPQPPFRLVNLGSVVALTTASGQVQSIVAQGEKP